MKSLSIFGVLWVALNVDISSSALAAEPVEPWVGQDLNSAGVLNHLGTWWLGWLPHRDHAGTEIKVDLAMQAETDVGVAREWRVSVDSYHGIPSGVAWRAKHEQAYVQFSVESSERSCGNAVARIVNRTVAVNARDRELAMNLLVVQTLTRRYHGREDLAKFVGLPRCGARMVETVSAEGHAKVVSCVDRAWGGAPALSQLDIVVEDGLVNWMVSPMPSPGGRSNYPFDEHAPIRDSMPWDISDQCHPLFARRSIHDIAPPRRNTAIAFDWVTDTDLLAMQAWKDDSETGFYVLLYGAGRPATVGYRFEGLQHGMWYYFGPDSSLIEARLYALGVELERLPVKTTGAHGG